MTQDNPSDDLSPSLGGGAAQRTTNYEPSLSLDRLLPGLRDALGSDDRGQRLETIEQIIEGGSERVVPMLIELLQDVDNAKSRQRIVAMLGQLSDARAVGALVDLLNDVDAGLRKVVVWALGQIGSAEAVDPLLALLERESDPRVAGAAILSLGKIGDLKALRRILEYAAYEETVGLDYDDACDNIPTDPLVKVAWTALKLLGSTCSLPQLIEMLYSDDKSLRHWAVDRFFHHRAMPQPEHLPLLEKLLSYQERTEVRQKSIHLLAAMESKQARDIVLQMLVHPDDAMRLAAFNAVKDRRIPEALDILLTRYAEETGRYCEAVVEAIAVMDDPRVVPFLLDLVERDDRQWGVTQALRAQTEVDVSCLLLERLPGATEEARLNLLGSLYSFNSPAAIAVLLDIAHHSRNETERRAAVFAIHPEEYPETIPDLIDILHHDPSVSVRQSVIWKLVDVFDAQIETVLRAYLAEIDNDELRAGTLCALLSCEVPDAPSLLLEQLERIKDEEALAGIIHHFNVLENEVAFNLMEQLYRTVRSETLRVEIIDELLNCFNHAGVVPLVLDALQHDSGAGVRSCAADTLYYLGSDQQIVREALVEALNDTGLVEHPHQANSHRVCDTAAYHLQYIDDPRVVAALAAWREAPGFENMEKAD